MCYVHLECIYGQFTQPTEDLRKKIFWVKNEGHIH